MNSIRPTCRELLSAGVRRQAAEGQDVLMIYHPQLAFIDTPGEPEAGKEDHIRARIGYLNFVSQLVFCTQFHKIVVVCAEGHGAIFPPLLEALQVWQGRHPCATVDIIKGSCKQQDHNTSLAISRCVLEGIAGSVYLAGLFHHDESAADFAHMMDRLLCPREHNARSAVVHRWFLVEPLYDQHAPIMKPEGPFELAEFERTFQLQVVPPGRAWDLARYQRVAKHHLCAGGTCCPDLFDTAYGYSTPHDQDEWRYRASNCGPRLWAPSPSSNPYVGGEAQDRGHEMEPYANQFVHLVMCWQGAGGGSMIVTSQGEVPRRRVTGDAIETARVLYCQMTGDTRRPWTATNYSILYRGYYPSACNGHHSWMESTYVGLRVGANPTAGYRVVEVAGGIEGDAFHADVIQPKIVEFVAPVVAPRRLPRTTLGLGRPTQLASRRSTAPRPDTPAKNGE